MSNFNATRFKTLLKYEITTQHKSYLRLFIASFLGMLAYMIYDATEYIQYTNYHKAVWPDSEVYPYDTEDILAFGGFFIFFITLICASRIFSNMDTKQNRIRLLMLPATNLEKYLCRWSIYVVMALGALVATYVAADITAAIIRLCIGLPFDLSVIQVFEDISATTWNVKDFLGFITNASLLVAGVSTYVLGGTLFRKVPFIFTSIIIGAAWFSIMIASLIFIIIFANNEANVNIFFDNLEEESILVFIITLLQLWSVFAHWISYRLFCRSSVIGHKRIGM